MKYALLFLMTIICTGIAFGKSAAELAQMCDSLDAKGAEIAGVERNSDLGYCLGYLNAVFDYIPDSTDLQVIKDFALGDTLISFRHYAKAHYAEPAKDAIVNAMIKDGYIKRK